MRTPFRRCIVLSLLVVVGLATSTATALADDVDDDTPVAGTPCTASADACVDLDAKQAWLVDGDGLVMLGPVPLSSGGPGYETPRGVFSVEWRNRDHRSAEFDNAPMPFAVFFAKGGIAFHGGDVTKPSHGCVRLPMADAEAFFDWLLVGSEVQIF